MRTSGGYIFKILMCASLSVFSQAALSGQYCQTKPSAQEIFHGNNIRTVISNTGNLFRQTYDRLFQVPFSGAQSTNSLFVGGLWLGGFDEGGNLKVAAQTLGGSTRFDYGPGPLTSGGTTSPLTCGRWDVVWLVNRNDVLRHQEDFEDNGHIDDSIPSIFGWPGRGNSSFYEFNGFPLAEIDSFGAPFVDLNYNKIYEPQLGEYPHPTNVDPGTLPMLTAWTVYNDNSNIHTSSQGNPLKCDVQLTMYTFSCDESLLNESLFVSYKIVNRGTSSIDSFFMSQWLYPHIGGAGCNLDDAVGCFPDGNTFFVYNLDNDDDCNGPVGNPTGYGKNPPVISTTFLNRDMSSFMYYNIKGIGTHPNAMTDPQPGAPHEFYRYMSGSWKDGTPLSEGGSGYNVPPATLTKFAMSGDPADSNSWAMTNEDLGVGDHLMVGSIGLPRLGTGQVVTIDMVYAFHRDTTRSNLGNVSLMYENVEQLQEMYNVRFIGACDYPGIACTDDCVYPGDTDHDGRVSSKDYINTAVGLGAEGPERRGPISFLPLTADEWANTTQDNTNYKHLDCTGDGKIGKDDLDIIDFHYGNQAYWYRPDAQQYGDAIQILPERSEMVVGEEFFKVEVHFNALDIDSLYGLVFSFEYDADKFDDVIPVEFAPLFSGPLIKRYPEEGKHDFIMVGTDLKNRAVEDQLIAKFEFFGSYDIIFTPPVDTTYFRITDVKAVLADGTILDLHGQEVPLYLVLEPTSTDDLKSNSIRIYPNPSRGQITIENNGLPVGTPYSVLNSLGQIVTGGQLDGDMTHVDLPAGLFYVVVRDDEVTVKKVVVID